MLKKAITYDDYNDNTVTEDFFFNFTKLELMEKELELGGLEKTIKHLSETDNAKEAYNLFKDIILAAYGQKSEDGKRFIKSKELTTDFEQSPALSELIMEFLEFPDHGAAFIEGTIPPKLVKEVKDAQSKRNSEVKTTDIRQIADDVATRQTTDIELPTSPPVLEDSTTEKSEPSDEELVKMSPQAMSYEQLQRAFRLKNDAN